MGAHFAGTGPVSLQGVWRALFSIRVEGYTQPITAAQSRRAKFNLLVDSFGLAPRPSVSQRLFRAPSCETKFAVLYLRRVVSIWKLEPVIRRVVSIVDPVLLLVSAAILLLLGVVGVAHLHDRRMEKRRLQYLKKWVGCQESPVRAETLPQRKAP